MLGRAYQYINRLQNKKITPALAINELFMDAGKKPSLEGSPSQQLVNTVKSAWDVGRQIPLGANVIYGPAHWKGRQKFNTETFPYYYFLAGLVRTTGCSRILEIGTHYGGSVQAMLAGITPPSTANIVTVDISDLNKDIHSLEGVTKLTGDANSDAITKQIALSFDFSPIDLLYVDAAHHFTPTIVNIGLYVMLLKPRLVVIDDILLNEEMRHVWHAMKNVYGGNAINCVDVVSDIRRENVGFGLIDTELRQVR